MERTAAAPIRSAARLWKFRVIPAVHIVAPFRRHAAGLALLALALATPVAAETLADAMTAAYARNPSLNRQQLLQKARDEQYVQARSQYGPTLNLQADGGYQYQRAAGQSADTDNGRLFATITQPLYSAGRIRGQIAAARADIRSGQEQLRDAEQQTVQNVIIVYAAVLRDEQRLAVGRENVIVLEEQLRRNRARRRVGDVTITDVSQADARLAAAEQQLAGLAANLATSRGQYLQVVGNNPGALEPLPDLGALPKSIDEAFDLAESDNPTLLAAKYAEQSSSASAAAVRGERGPSVSLTGQGIYTNRLAQFSGPLGRKQAVASFTVTQPLFAAGAIQSRVREADARNSADQAAIDLARRNALQAVTVAWSQLTAARIALVAGERQVASAQIAFAGMSREELNGLRSTIETLNTEQELQGAQLDLLQNRYQAYVLQAALLSAIGSLRPTTIAPDLVRYDPEANFRRIHNRGMTPFEPVAMALDRIGSAGPRRPIAANLTGAGVPRPENAAALPPAPGSAQLSKPLVPITQSRLVPASELPDGMPPADPAIDAPDPRARPRP